MHRAAGEELVKDQKATGGDLYKKIDSLSGEMSLELIEALHEARMLGNDSIHAGITYSAEEVEDVAKLTDVRVSADHICVTVDYLVQPGCDAQWALKV